MNQSNVKPINIKHTKEYSILEFQNRVYDLILLEETPLMEKLNFIKIIMNNIEDFLGSRLQDVGSDDITPLIEEIENIYQNLGMTLQRLVVKYSIPEIQAEKMNKIIYQQMIPYIYSEENDIQNYVDISESLDAHKEYINLYSKVPDSNASYNVHIPAELFEINQYIELFRKKYGAFQYKKDIFYVQNQDYYHFLVKKDILIRTPYESYSCVTDFIDQMCSQPNVRIILITLYRFAENSKIINSLLKAHKLGKSVFVYIELTARGDENHNLDTAIRLKKYGINVSTTYFDYKVHSKLFCAIDKDGRKFAHVGTGNYNENTAKAYTDCHLLTCDDRITNEVTKVLLSIFQKTVYMNRKSENPIINAPTNLRTKIITLINREIKKGLKGKIWIKCNNLYDTDIINYLYKASDNGVDVKIICRTRCGITYPSNMEIRSKVGQYLEHDRIYVFGNDVYTASADLLTRNISKRVEIMCRVPNGTKEKLIQIFLSVWYSSHIHKLTEDGRWVVS